MAEWAALPSCVQLQLHRTCFKPCNLMPKNVHCSLVQRNHFCGRRILWVPSHKECKLGGPLSITFKRSRHLKESSLRYWCLGTLIDIENETPLSWVAIVDQVLLATSVAFAYMAGVVTSEKAYSNTPNKDPSQQAVTSRFTPSGRYGTFLLAVKSEDWTNSEHVWNEVQVKLSDALDAVEHDGNLESRVVKSENYGLKRPLSLSAVAEGPRLRLLAATLQQLHKEVSGISGMHEVVHRDAWLVVLSETVQRSIRPICERWLEQELCLEREQQNRALLAGMLERLKGDDTILLNMKKSGKEDLYADFLFFLRFGSLRNSCHYDGKLLVQHGVDILEDLMITLADGITSVYLELISVDSSMSGEISHLGLVLCSLSTRELQKLRNEVALSQWLHQNLESVVSMYEDRFDLCTLQTCTIGDAKKIQIGRSQWWKKLTLQKPAVNPNCLCYVVISQLSLPVRRTKELRALTGWRYSFSLFLELSDISMPMVRAIVDKISSAISFFLVCLIGRSLGLIYTGIRQALGWR